MHKIFLSAIQNKQVVYITFDSFEKWIISRKCIPFDFWPSRRYKDWKDRYHFYDLDSPEWSHNLSILPSQLLHIELTGEYFNPADCVTFTPNWYIPRDWWKYS